MQRFNDHEFAVDKTAFDKLARMQHYLAPTRMLDMSEDVLSALYFALDQPEAGETGVVYVLEIDPDQVKYYDSDAVSVVANLAKSPLTNDGASKEKSKTALHWDAARFLHDRVGFNGQVSVDFHLHDVREEKSYFRSLIDPAHLFSVLCVKPKYTNERLHGQKGAFLLFGMNFTDANNPIKLLQDDPNQADALRINASLESGWHPIRKLTKIRLGRNINLKSLARLGVTKPYVYPEMDKVAEYLKAVHKEDASL
jgi:FRG domain